MDPKSLVAPFAVAAVACLGFAALAGGQAQIKGLRTQTKPPVRRDKVVLTDAQWKAKLPPAVYGVVRKEGTEAPFSSPLNSVHEPGTFVSAATGQPLFRTSDKFDSGTGWPSFVRPITKDAVWYRVDRTLGMARIEVLSSRDDGHLGHVFDDGPADRGGLRYCMNGAALRFIPDKK